MKKFVKIAAIVVAVILAVALIVPFALRGKIADIVKREANEMLAAKLDFEKLDISLLRHFPNASLDLKGLTLVGVDRFEGDTIVAAQRISVVVNVMSLFGDEGFEVTKIILSEPALHAHKLADAVAEHHFSALELGRHALVDDTQRSKPNKKHKAKNGYRDQHGEEPSQSSCVSIGARAAIAAPALSQFTHEYVTREMVSNSLNG